MTTVEPVEKNHLSCCCIIHEFYKAASKTPNKIAVIHAHGGAKIAAEFRRIYSTATKNQTSEDDDKLFDEFMTKKTVSSNPTVYEGDKCFTFSDIVTAVESLSSRIRAILDGGEDPSIIKPTSVNHGKQSVHDQISIFTKSSEHQNIYTPTILGIYMVPSVEYIIAVLSVLRCGEAFMPLDPSWPKEKILSIVSSSKPDFIIGPLSSIDVRSCHYPDSTHWLVDSSICPVLFISIEDNLRYNFGLSNLVWPCEKERLRQFCYLMYTSGSTGKPKGVCGTESGLVNRFLWMQELYPLHGEELLLFKTSVSFIDHMQEFLGPLLKSCTLVVPSFDELKKNLFTIVDYLQEYSISRLVAVPSVMRVILSTLQSQRNMKIQDSLKLLVLSGEILHLSLWNMLTGLLPKTTILNFYGSTEVSGDCTYFDCKRLHSILEGEELNSVPIGTPISKCEVVLIGEDAPNEGEVYVSGVCVACGYLSDLFKMPLDYVKLREDSPFSYSMTDKGIKCHFKTGDFARRLESGDLVFLGRKDRMIKINGQRISLDEIERTLRDHEDVVDAAVISRQCQGRVPLLEGYLVTKVKDEDFQVLTSSIRSWMVNKVTLAMIPNSFFCIKSLPMSPTGKVDYTLLASLRPCATRVSNEIEELQSGDILQLIKKAFCDALMVEKFSSNDDFFAMGGDSISAAHASHSIGIDMRLLYTFPTPLKLQLALVEQEVSVKRDRTLLSHTEAHMLPAKRSKMDSFNNSDIVSPRNLDPWTSNSVHVACSFSRGNTVIYGEEYGGNNLCKAARSDEISRNKNGSMQELWKVHLESCVDASPLLVFRERDIYLYIGSHSYKFLCINAKSGSVQWEVKLQGRIECSAAILDSFSQVVVGCYKGNIYFLDSLDGNIFWTFQTGGEVKSQPLVDKSRHLVWCGSYDHNIYALDYRGYCCVYKLPCGGSINGSPAIDEVHDQLYVAATSGLMTAISIQAAPFSKLWLQDLGAPVFGSLVINSCNGNVICSLVSGDVVALNAAGSIVWRAKTGGPIFAGPCISRVLPSQVLICARDGSIYSFELETGDLLWEHSIGDPITSSAYADENLQLLFDASHLSERLICVCASSGRIHVLKIHFEAYEEKIQPPKVMVKEYASFDLRGDIFSSPVMIGGRIFVGCRDDYVHCIEIKGLFSVEK